MKRLKRPRDAGPKRSHYSQTSSAQSPLKPLYTSCNMLLTGLYHPPAVSIPILLPQTLPYSPLHARKGSTFAVRETASLGQQMWYT